MNDENPQFEAWARPRFKGVDAFKRVHHPDGVWEYASEKVQAAWAAWQQRGMNMDPDLAGRLRGYAASGDLPPDERSDLLAAADILDHREPVVTNRMLPCPCGAPCDVEKMLLGPYPVPPGRNLYRLTCTNDACTWSYAGSTPEQALQGWNRRLRIVEPVVNLATPGTREAEMVVLETDEEGVPTIWCDPEIVDLVRALNIGGVRTVSSCSGHSERLGSIALADGRVLVICPSLDTASELVLLHNLSAGHEVTIDLTTSKEAEVRDPHHNGMVLWKWEDGKLFQRLEGQSKWVHCKKISVTPARVAAIASALPVHPQPAPETPEEEGRRLATEGLGLSDLWGRVSSNNFEHYGRVTVAFTEACTQPDWKTAPPDATHYQPHQKAFYKRVSASEWFVWSRYEANEPLRWLRSPGTCDNADWVVRPVDAPQEAE